MQTSSEILTKVQAVTARHALLWVHNESMHLRVIAIQIEDGLPDWRAEVKSGDLRRGIQGLIDRLQIMLDTDLRTP